MLDLKIHISVKQDLCASSLFSEVGDQHVNIDGKKTAHVPAGF